MRSFFTRALQAARWLDDHWIGDAIGVASLFLMLWIFLLVAEVLR